MTFHPERLHLKRQVQVFYRFEPINLYLILVKERKKAKSTSLVFF